MNYKCIACEEENGIAILKLIRPEVLKAANKQIGLGLREAMHGARED